MAENQKSWRDQVVEEIIGQIEAGTAPWQKPWTPGVVGQAPFNPVSGKPYRGINSVWLETRGYADPRWMTYNQAQDLGAQVRKGERGTSIEYWKWTDRQPVLDTAGNPIVGSDGRQQYRDVQLSRPKVFYARVFNAEQIDGLAPYIAPAPTFEPLQEAERLLAGGGVKIFFDQSDRAFYSPTADSIRMPPAAAFKEAYEYYTTALHELGHATGHRSRMDREFGPFGSEVYAREELRAELSSYMVGRDLGIGHYPERHASYAQSWLKVLRNDRNALFQAARDAELIATWIKEPEKRLQIEQTMQAQRKEAKMENEPSFSVPEMGPALAGPRLDGGYRFEGDPRKEADNEFDIMDWKVSEDEKQRWIEQRSAAIAEAEVRNFPADKVERLRAEISDIYEKIVEFEASEREDREEAQRRGNEYVRSTESNNLIVGLKQHLTTLEVEKARFDAVLDQKRERNAQASAELGELAQHTDAGPSAQDRAHAGKRPKIWLNVPFAEKEAAKAAGASWDRQHKSWYVREGQDLDAVKQWRTTAAPARVEMRDPVEEFGAFLKHHGVELKGPPVMDGSWQRVSFEDDKPGAKNGSYRGFLDGRANGQLKNYKSDQLHQWVAGGEMPGPAEMAALREQAAQQRQRRQAELETTREMVAKDAAILWDRARLEGSTAPDRGYLNNKQVGAHGIRYSEELPVIYVPMRDIDGKLHSLQMIDEDHGTKMFIKGGRMEGLMHVIDPKGKLGREQAIICEGYSTAATLHELTDRPVVVAFNAGNLMPVATALREKYPQAQFAIAADNDHKLENRPIGNVGLNKAQEASTAINALLLVPPLTKEEKAKGLTDWNDLYVSRGRVQATAVLRNELQRAQARTVDRETIQKETGFFGRAVGRVREGMGL